MEASRREAVVALFKKGKSTSDIVKSLHVNRVFVWRVLKHYKETGLIELQTCARPRPKRTFETVKLVHEKVRENPDKSVRKMAEECNISRDLFRKILKDDLRPQVLVNYNKDNNVIFRT
jgi:transposase